MKKRWRQHDSLLREKDRKGASEDTPLRRVPWLLLVLGAVLVVAWVRPSVPKRRSVLLDAHISGGAA